MPLMNTRPHLEYPMTTIYYPDIEITSPNGHYILRATSPDNQTEKKEAGFQKNFIYQLIDSYTDTVLWTRQQTKLEASPRHLYLSNDGWSVIQVHGLSELGLVAVSLNGQDNCYISIKPKQDGNGEKLIERVARRHWIWRNKQTIQSNAGILLTYAHFYFTQFEQRPLFILASYWGRRLVLDLQSGQLSTDTAQKRRTSLGHWLDRQETIWAEEILDEVVDNIDQIQSTDFSLSNNDIPYRLRERFFLKLPIAILMAGRLGLSDHVSTLHKLEQVVLPKSGYHYADGIGNNYVYETHKLRRFINHAFLLLDERPSIYPCYSFFFNKTAYQNNQPLTIPKHIPDRQARLPELQPGMDGLTVLKLLGAPDCIGDQWWEYDIYAGNAERFCVRLYWADLKLSHSKPHPWTEEYLMARLEAIII